MISLLFSLLIGWLLLRWLCRGIERLPMPAPSPQIVIHIHSANVLVQRCPQGERGRDLNFSPVSYD